MGESLSSPEPPSVEIWWENGEIEISRAFVSLLPSSPPRFISPLPFPSLPERRKTHLRRREWANHDRRILPCESCSENPGLHACTQEWNRLQVLEKIDQCDRFFFQVDNAKSMGEGLSKEAAGLGSDLQKQGMDAVGQAQKAGMGALDQAKQTGQGLVQQGQQSLSKGRWISIPLMPITLKKWYYTGKFLTTIFNATTDETSLR